MKRGKKYQDAVKAYDRSAQYDVAEAIDLVKKNATAKFDETIELHLRTVSVSTHCHSAGCRHYDRRCAVWARVGKTGALDTCGIGVRHCCGV